MWWISTMCRWYSNHIVSRMSTMGLTPEIIFEWINYRFKAIYLRRNICNTNINVLVSILVFSIPWTKIIIGASHAFVSKSIHWILTECTNNTRVFVTVSWTTRWLMHTTWWWYMSQFSFLAKEIGVNSDGKTLVWNLQVVMAYVFQDIYIYILQTLI